MSKKMLEHYSHVRMAAKRGAVDKLSAGLMDAIDTDADQTATTLN